MTAHDAGDAERRDAPLLRDHGTWELADVLAPALGYAAGRVPLVPCP